MRTGFYFDPIYLQHDTGSHPENAGRLQFLIESMAKTSLLDELQQGKARKAEVHEIQLIHELNYIRSVEDACAVGQQQYFGSMDCIISGKTYEAALHATGAILDAVNQVADQKLDNAFCAVRPPGHHAENSEAMGFCYFNNVAIAAEFLVKEKGYERVLIFDFDVHHGNGTQHSFEARNDIFYCSIHQDPRICYPGTGYASERGVSDGTGYTLNCPMPPYSDDERYLQVFHNNILPVFQDYAPDFILISAGFDAHRDDPLAQESLTVEGFDGMLEGMKTLAYHYAEGRMVSVLEGGYDYQALSDSIQSHLEILLKDPA
ncbi:MAG: histone deacetylase [SAR324 cluster bacterium]|nr:histone deacetylase [SAR324 cluster bacterium]